MNTSVMSAAQLFGRFLMAVIFVRGGYFKLLDMDPVVAMLASHGMPMPGLLYYGVMGFELIGGIVLFLGWQTRSVALAMAVYSVWTAVIAHWVPGNEGQLINFYKNICMAGGFLQLFAVGGGAWSVDGKLKS